jgi:hypothetical protein
MTRVRLTGPLVPFQQVVMNADLSLRARGLYGIVRTVARDAHTVITLDEVVPRTGLEPEAVEGLLDELAGGNVLQVRR